MRALVQVVAADEEYVWVTLAQRARDCGGCAGICSMLFARSGRAFRLPATALDSGVNTNDQLIVGVGAGTLLKTTALACGFPLAGLLTGAGLAATLGSPEWAPPLMGLLGLGVGTVLAGAVIARGEALRLSVRHGHVT